LALADLFFLLVYVLNRGDLNHDWLFARCREVQASPNGHLDLWPREHFKSSIINTGLTIQDILRDPEITVGIFSYNRPTAKKFLGVIKREFEGNEKLRSLFPDILWENPQRDAPKWSEDEGIIVRRRGNPKESTVEAHGLVESQPTSRHFRLMVYDDVVTKDSVTTPDQIRRTTDSWEMSLALSSDGGAIRYIGTRYHFNDTYRTILERGSAIERRHTITYDGTVDGEPVLWTRAQVAKRRRDQGPYTFGSQMLLNPIADAAQGFKEEWLREFEFDGSNYAAMNKYLLVDAASSKRKDSDYTAIGVIGLAADQNYYLLDGIRDRLNLTERADAIFALHRRWRPLGVGYEQYGMMADVEYLKERQKQENYRFEITELGGQTPKPDRIRWLIPVFEAGRFYLPEHLIKIDYEGRHVDLVQAFIREEYLPFPVGLARRLFRHAVADTRPRFAGELAEAGAGAGRPICPLAH
jgi:phage terminase large subunit-like protein